MCVGGSPPAPADKRLTLFSIYRLELSIALARGIRATPDLFARSVKKKYDMYGRRKKP